MSRALALFWIAALIVGTFGIELISPQSAFEQNVDNMLASPSWQHPFGTDSLGRDLFSRILIGSKISLSIGLCGSLLSVGIGALFALLCTWKGGWAERAFLRLSDVFLSIPGFALMTVWSLAIQKVWLDPSGLLAVFTSLVTALALTHWASTGKTVRGLVLSLKSASFIESARALGAGETHILRRHLWPHLTPGLLVLIGLQIPTSILYESMMSFAGLGVQAPQTSWGLLVQEGWRALTTEPHLILFPSLVLFLTVWSLHSLMPTRRSIANADRS